MSRVHNCGGRIPVKRVTTIEDAVDFQIVALVAEEDPVVLSPEPNQRRHDALELFGTAFAREYL